LKEGGRHGSLWWRTLCKVCVGVGTGVGNSFEDNIHRPASDGNNTFFWTDNLVGGVPLLTKFRRVFDLVVHRECSVANMAVLGWEYGGECGCG